MKIMQYAGQCWLVAACTVGVVLACMDAKENPSCWLDKCQVPHQPLRYQSLTIGDNEFNFLLKYRLYIAIYGKL